MARSLHSSEGVVLYSTQVSFGTAVTPATSLGIADYNATDDGDYRQFFTLGSKNLYLNKGGIAKVDWQVRQSGLANKTLLLAGVRTSGELPWITWGFGSDPIDAAPEAWQVQDSKVNQMEISLDGGGILSGSLSGIGGQKSILTSLTASAGTENPMMSYEAVLTLAAAAFEVKSFRVSINHNLTAESVIRGAAVSTARQRLWDYLTEGNEEITGSVTLARKNTKDFQAVCPAADGTMVLTLTNVCDSTSIVLTLTSVEFLSQARNFPADGYASFELPFNAKSFSLA